MCRSPWGHKELDMTELLNNNNLRAQPLSHVGDAVPMAQPRNRGLKRHSKMLKTLPRSAHLMLGHPCLLDLAASSVEADTLLYFLCINWGLVLVDG